MLLRVHFSRPSRVRMTPDACRVRDRHPVVRTRRRSGPLSPRHWSAKCTASPAHRTARALDDDDQCAAHQASSCRSRFYAADGLHARAGCCCAAEHHARCVPRAGQHHLASHGVRQRVSTEVSTVQPCRCGSPSKPIAERLRRVAHAYELNTQ